MGVLSRRMKLKRDIDILLSKTINLELILLIDQKDANTENYGLQDGQGISGI